VRAVANGAAVAVGAAPAASPAPTTWPSVVALAHGREPMLHAHLLHDVHPVRLAPGRLEIRVLPKAPRDLAAKLSALLETQTGARWVVALSHEPGEPTLAEQSRHAEEGRRDAARAHPLVQAILAAFPGATLQEVRDDSLDAYGLPPKPAEPEDDAMAEREFAPPDALPYDPEEDDTP
jgi:DNA polymerase-3 subunit gamma/tau